MADVLLVASAMSACVCCGWWLHAVLQRPLAADPAAAWLKRLLGAARSMHPASSAPHATADSPTSPAAVSRPTSAEPELIRALAQLLASHRDWRDKLDAAESTRTGLPERSGPSAVRGTDRVVARGAWDRLPARDRFVSDLRRHAALWYRGGAPVSVVLLRVERFGALLAEGGACVVGGLLQASAQFLEASLRESDLVARYDDDTFALLLPATEQAQAGEIAERLRQAMMLRAAPLASGLRFGLSGGCAGLSETGNDERLLRSVEECLETATARGGGLTVSHIPAASETPRATAQFDVRA